MIGAQVQLGRSVLVLTTATCVLCMTSYTALTMCIPVRHKYWHSIIEYHDAGMLILADTLLGMVWQCPAWHVSNGLYRAARLAEQC